MDFFIWIIVAIVCIVILLIIILNSSISKKPNQTYQCERRPDAMLTNNEIAFYKSLLPIANTKGLTVFAKVRIADLIRPRKGAPNRQTITNKTNQKHVDFVLCDNSALKPVIIVELDDRSHEREDRKQRDDFVDKAFASAQIPILHTSNSNQLEEKLDKLIPRKKVTVKK